MLEATRAIEDSESQGAQALLVGKYAFHTTITRTAVLPVYKGSVFRGALGAAIRRTVCTVRQQDCTHCLLCSRCLFARFFEPTQQAGRVSTAQPPYVIEPPLNEKRQYAEGESFDFSLLLFGELNEHLPYLVYAVMLMGEQGIGRPVGGRRGRFRLDLVRDHEKIVYDGESAQLRPAQAQRIELRPTAAANGPDRGTLAVSFLTPARITEGNSLAAALPFHLLVRRMLSRIAALFAQYGTGEPWLPYADLVRLAKDVEQLRSGLHWRDWRRYSARQGDSMYFGGLLGEVCYGNVPAAFRELAELCAVLHIGKQTSFGLGQYRCTWQEQG